MPSTNIVIDARPDELWRMVTDVTRMGEWSPETVSAEWVDGAAGPAVGARFKGQNKRLKGWATTCTVTEAQPGRTFAFKVGKGETTWRYDFAPVGATGPTASIGATGPTVVTESFEIVKVPGKMGRWLTKVATGVEWSGREADMLAGAAETLRRLKAAAEPVSSAR